MLTVSLFLIGGAFLVALFSAGGKVPLRPAVVLLAIERMLTILPK